MPYWETCSNPDFHTSVTSQALVAWSRQDRKADTGFPPTEITFISSQLAMVGGRRVERKQRARRNFWRLCKAEHVRDKTETSGKADERKRVANVRPILKPRKNEGAKDTAREWVDKSKKKKKKKLMTRTGAQECGLSHWYSNTPKAWDGTRDDKATERLWPMNGKEGRKSYLRES